jgi:hypothetical protein
MQVKDLYYNKYLKYKNKYLNSQIGGNDKEIKQINLKIDKLLQIDDLINVLTAFLEKDSDSATVKDFALTLLKAFDIEKANEFLKTKDALVKDPVQAMNPALAPASVQAMAMTPALAPASASVPVLASAPASARGQAPALASAKAPVSALAPASARGRNSSNNNKLPGKDEYTPGFDSQAMLRGFGYD